ncbi:PiggyBac transposable element-derived protein 4 [Acipenser ruthenus]|uniref:PiggyBac transposable element-derived protein 4 n=1 Tax=Acipenser ruthenus TaxID=7906 RepID=A0A444UAQ3_ACIRT|nr:PiggyBac transposable element-derived protein 4 [Acipenser ruthenus]
MLWKGRLSFMQYIPSKQHHFGIKFFIICDVKTRYILNVIVYTGGTTDILHDVLSLMKPYLDKGHIVYTDNWYNSPALFECLHSQDTDACGTVRSNRKRMPQFKTKLEKGEVHFLHTDKLLAAKWHVKRDVHILTSVHRPVMKVTNNVDHATGDNKVKPECVLEYNQKMGSVDKSDMQISFVDCARYKKWYKKLFFHLFDMAVLNAFILHKTASKKKKQSLSASSGTTSSRTQRRCHVCSHTTRRPRQRKDT